MQMFPEGPSCDAAKPFPRFPDPYHEYWGVNAWRMVR